MPKKSTTITHEEIVRASQVEGIRWELLRIAAAIIDGIPEHHFDLDDIRRNPASNLEEKLCGRSACGTIGCAMGWLIMHPSFNAIGLRDGSEVPNSTYVLVEYQPPGTQRAKVGIFSAAAGLFAISYSMAESLFGAVLDHEYDHVQKALLLKRRPTHKQIFRHRVKTMLAKYGQLDSQKRARTADTQG